MSDPSAPWATAAAAIAARRGRERADEQLARQLQEQEVAAAVAADTATAAAAAADPSAARRHSALRRIANDGGSDGGEDRRRATLGLDPSAGDEVAFYLTRVAGQQNRCSLSLGVILSGDVQRAILVNYMIDVPWMLQYFPQLLTWPRVDMVMGRERGKPIDATRNPHFSNITHYNAPLPVMHGVHHSKVAILLYASGCRVAVCTANFIGVDWLWKNNASFVQDFPRKNQCSPRTSDFETALMDYVEPYRAGAGLDVSALREFDFSAAKAVLIPSVPGYHKGADMHRYGHMRLRAVLAREPLAPKFARAPIVAQFSSLGSISEKWLLDELRVSMAARAPPRGGTAASVPTGPTAPAAAAPPASASAGAVRAGPGASAPAFSGPTSLPPLRLIWPTVESVRTSLEGWSAGGSLCCDDKNMKDMLRPYLHVWDGEGQRRHRAMPHIKSYLRAADDGELAWCLITSANCSNSAWGQLQKDATQLMIRHYEMGVLFTPTHYARALQLLKARNQMHFTCTPLNPLVNSPKPHLSAVPYFVTREGQQRNTGGAAAAASSHSAAAAASPAASASPQLPLPAPPVVRLFLLPPLSASGRPVSASAGFSSTAAASAPASVAATSSKRHVEDLTGDDGGGGEAEWVSAAAAHPAKRSRVDEPSSTPSANAVSTQLIRPSAASAASSGTASVSVSVSVPPPIEHVVICPIPYDVNSRPYNFAKDKPWVWDQDFMFADCHGNIHRSGRAS